MLTTVFWIFAAIIVYTYFGYTSILFFISLFTRRKSTKYLYADQLPDVTLLVAAYNEREIINDKIANSFSLNYPKDKLKHLWITDGSDDDSEKILSKIEGVQVLHQSAREGKTAALNRAMKQVKTPVTIFSDANSMLSPDSVYQMVLSLNSKNVGCVAGEKRILSNKKDKAPGAGEGFYWNYESILKHLESQVGSTLGAAGELYAIRTRLYSPPLNNVILDDFVVTLSIAQKGYKLAYQPNAVATESSSLNIREELKRKIRIASGAFQVLFGIPSLLNIFKHFFLSFQYFSHKVLRWLFVPFSILGILLTNIAIVYKSMQFDVYFIFAILQAIFYLLVISGFLLKNRNIRFKFIFLPYYLILMNYSLVVGLARFIKGGQKAAWEKSKRS